MKNVLFASTALVAFGFAGAAFAEAHASTSISLSGSAELGFTSVDTGGSGIAGGDIQLHNDFDLTWSLTGMTDGGISFGASGDWDEAPTEESTSAFISGAFGTITIGDTDGAYDKAMIEASSAGIVDEADFYVNGHSGLDGAGDAEKQVGRYDIAFGGTTLSVSYENGTDAVAAVAPTPGNPGTAAAAERDEVYGVGAAFSFGSVSMGLGYQAQDDANVAGISASVELGVVALTLAYEASEDQAGVDSDNIQGSAVFDLGTSTVGVNFDLDDEDGGDEQTGYGLWYSYSLGGGATFTAAAGYNETDPAVGASTDETRFGAGIGMSF